MSQLTILWLAVLTEAAMMDAAVLHMPNVACMTTRDPRLKKMASIHAIIVLCLIHPFFHWISFMFPKKERPFFREGMLPVQRHCA